MKNPFKKEEKINHKMVFTGKVKFIHDDKIKSGTIFGSPYRESLIGSNLYYHIVEDGTNKVHWIAEHCIDKDFKVEA